MSRIYNFLSADPDRTLLEQALSSRAGASVVPDTRDYSNVIVKKPWGYEYLALDNSQVAIWVLHIARKRKTSMHCHPGKTTGLIVLSGNVQCSGLDGCFNLGQIDAVQIDKGCFHSTEAFSDSPIYPPSENGVWIMEIEAPSNKTDLVRANDAYGRAGKAYEGSDSMVDYRHDWLKIRIPATGQTDTQKHMGCVFSVRAGHYSDAAGEGAGVAAVIEYRGGGSGAIPGLEVGRLYETGTLRELISGRDVSDYVFLTIVKEVEQMKLSDYVASFIADLGVKDVFSVSGGGAMHLVDSVGKSERLAYIPTHHEQAAAMAAEAYSRIAGMGVGLFTTGPGGTNALTGVACAWIDSIPTLYLSGQVTRDTLLDGTGLRQYGIQESDVVTLARPITKYAVCVTNEKDIRYELEKAAYIAKSGRPGPVWVDIPLDVQSRQINPSELRGFTPPPEVNSLRRKSVGSQVESCLSMLRSAKRPVLICGYGVRLAGAQDEFRRLVDSLGIPVVSSWTASDLLDSSNPYYVGRSGIFGDRPSNFAVQNADLLLVIGSRMSIPQVGYNYQTFAREARIVMVDIDQAEISKPSLHVDLGIVADARRFIVEMQSGLDKGAARPDAAAWVRRCQEWKVKYPVALPEYRDLKQGINSFYFVDRLSDRLPADAVVVTDMGTSFTCTMQTFKVKLGQRLTTASGHAPMGYGLPGAIGACFGNGRRKTICISGDGGLQMNIQELQTMAHFRLPIILFVINNGGYLTIKHMQQNHFGRYVGSESGSGLSCPDMMKVAHAYGIPARRIADQASLLRELDDVLAQPGPYICEIMMPEDQPLIPRLSSLKKPDGTIISKPLEDLYPFLDRKEFKENMLIPPTEVLD
ncbi:MAG: thiamine pyrophosphate-binding protein [Gammaproteobacteria bacterium]|nr:MAG: thiamine pyrophosphate-binding protein [Gammaproteobacteria bacterium]